MTAIESKDCAFCELQDAKLSPPPARTNYNQVLLESVHFVLIPALGPFTAGHALVVSRRHSSGVAWLPAEEQQDLVKFLNRLERSTPEVDLPLLFAEHGGSTVSNVPGPCITHTHVNVIPGVPLPDLQLEGARLLPTTELQDLATSDTPYFYLKRGRTAQLYDARLCAGQAIRRALWRSRYDGQWDWALHPSWDLVSETIRYWQASE